MILGRCLLRQTPPTFYFISCTVEVFPPDGKRYRNRDTEHNQRGGNGRAAAVGVGASGVGGISLINRTRIKGPERRGIIGIFGPHIKGGFIAVVANNKKGVCC